MKLLQINKSTSQINKINKIKSYRNEVINSASIDLEWVSYKGKYRHIETKIYAAAFCTNWGERIVLHISNYNESEFSNPERALIKDILFYFDQFPLTFGWYSTGITVYDDKTGNRVRGRDSDFFILHQRCLYYNLNSPFEIGYKGSYISLKKGSYNKHIDMMKVFGNKAIQYNVFEGEYTTTSLDGVSSALLGISKYGNMNAGSENILDIPIEEQKKYVKRDAELVMLLAQYKNSLVLRLMKRFSLYAEMDYFKVCNTDVGKWYENKYSKMISSGKITVKNTPKYKLEKQKFGGGHHTKPKKSFFINSTVYELDVKGMYGNIIINNNISFDTLNCSCCEDDPYAQVDQNIIDLINEYLEEKKISRRVSKCWICRKRPGALPLVLQDVLSDREKYLSLLKEEKSKPNPNNLLIDEYNMQQLAAKVFANVGYGLFGSAYFGYSNYKVAECITAEGRRIHKQMEIMAQEDPFNFEIVFGFTDSIFIKVDAKSSNKEELIREFIDRCKEELGMTVEVKNVFVNSIVYSEMNIFVGWSGKENEEPLIKGLEGLAYSTPLWVRTWVLKVVKDIIKKPQSRFETIPRLLDEAIFDLEHNVCASEENIGNQLKFTQRLSMYPNDYRMNNRTGLLGRLLEKDKGEHVWWYEIIGVDAETKGNFSTSIPKPENVNIKKYKGWLLDKLKDTLEIAGFDVKRIRLEIVEGIRSLI